MTNDPSADDFAALLAEQGSLKSKRLNPGDRVKAKIIHVGKDDVFCEVGPNQEGSIAKVELLDSEGELKVQIGDRLDLVVTSVKGGVRLGRKINRDEIDTEMLENARAGQIPVDGLVKGVNKGGLEVQLGQARAFCPIGQADINFVDKPEALVGQTLQFLVREIKEGGRNIVLSRKALLNLERAEKTKNLVQNLAVGQRVQGKVTRLADFGAFVDLGGVDGLIPVSELGHSRVQKPADVLNVGDVVTAEILRMEDDAKRPGQLKISLSLKATAPHPLEAHSNALYDGAVLVGKVVKLESFGAFVELFPGVQGLVHISEMAAKRIRHPADVAKIGDEVKVRVLKVDRGAGRIGLSIKKADSEGGGDGEQGDYAAYQASQSPGKSLGTLGDLLSKRGAKK